MRAAVYVMTAAVAAVMAVPFSAAAQRQQQEGPKEPFEDPGACPVAGCMYGEWTATGAVQARTERRAGASVAFQVSSGEAVTAITGVVVTSRVGRVGFRRDEILTSADGDLEIGGGQLLHLLISEGGGFWTVWYRGKIFREVDGGAFSSPGCQIEPSRCPANILLRPTSVWWVQIRNKAGQTGWINEPEKFDGKSRAS